MTKQEIHDRFVRNIEIEREKLGYTQAQMAKALNMSLSSYKNILNGTSTNIPIYVAYLVYELTGKLFFELFDNVTPEIEILIAFRNLPDYRKQALLTRIRIESDLSYKGKAANVNETKNSYIIPIHIPTGNMQDGMYYDTAHIEYLDLAKYMDTSDKNIDCGIKITSNHLHPAYHVGDILLICQAAPRDGDTGIFINKRTNKVYIRKFRQTSPTQLIPITDTGEIIYVDDNNLNEMNQWLKFGYVVTHLR